MVSAVTAQAELMKIMLSVQDVLRLKRYTGKVYFAECGILK